MPSVMASPHVDMCYVDSTTPVADYGMSIEIARSESTVINVDQDELCKSKALSTWQAYSKVSSMDSILHDMMILSADRTKVLFDEAFTSRGNKKQPSAERLIAWSNPESIISVAIDEFRKYGNEDRLSFTSSILLEFSNESVMSAFENLADRAVPEVISFLGILEYLDVSQKAIQNLIDRLRKNLTPAVFQAVSSYLGNCAIQRS